MLKTVSTVGISSNNISGLGTMALQNANNVAITGGTINTVTLNSDTFVNANITSVSTTFPNNFLSNSSATIGNTVVILGGTTTSIGNLTLSNVTITSGSIPNTVVTGLGTMAVQNANNVTITGGTENAVSYTNLKTTTLTGYLYGNNTAGFVTASTTIPNTGLGNSTLTLGNTVLTLGSTTTSVGNLTLSNVTIGTGAINVQTTNITSNTTANATFATSSLPLVPAGYIQVDLNGSVVKVPYYGV